MPLRGIYIPDFDQISVKNSVLGSYTLIVAPMGVKYVCHGGGDLESHAKPFSPLLHAKFHPIGATCHPCRAKNLKIGLE